MAGINIKNLTNTNIISDNDYIIVEQTTGTKKATVADITKSSTSVYYGENSDVIELQKPEMIEKVNNIENNLINTITDQSRLTSDKTITGAINELFTNVSNGKSLLASAITDKGIPTLATDSFEIMAKNIFCILTSTNSLVYKKIEGISEINAEKTIASPIKNLSIYNIGTDNQDTREIYNVIINTSDKNNNSKTYTINIPYKLEGTNNKQNELVQIENSNKFKFIRRVNSYIVNSNKWFLNKSNMPTARNALGTHLYNGKIYCIGGAGTSGNLSTVEIYDIETNSWSTGTNMPTARNSFTSQLYNGKIYCIGGSNSSVLSTVEIYDIETNSWSTGTNMPTARNGLTSVLYNDKIYCIAGNRDLSNAYSNLVEIYNIESNTWTSSVTNIPTARYHLTSQIYDNKIYCMGGANITGLINKVEAYDILTNTWSSLSVIPYSRFALTSQIIDNYIYCIGGTQGNNSYLNKVSKYDIINNIWTDDTELINGRYGLSSIKYNNVIYCIGGRNASNRLNNIDYFVQKKTSIIEELDSEEIIELSGEYDIQSYNYDTIITCTNIEKCNISAEINTIV